MKNKIIIGLLTVGVIITAAFFGIFIANNSINQTNTIDGIVVNIGNNTDYTSKMLREYEEYQDLLKKHDISIEKKKMLTKKDFKKYDYIIDYIPYDNDLKMTKSINVEVLEGGVEITYYLNHEVKTEDKLLLYLIPIPKNEIPNYSLANRIFKYES